MTTLIKSYISEYIPGDPGDPATSGSPLIPAYCSTTVEIVGRWVWVPRVDEGEKSPIPISSIGYPNSDDGYFVYVSGPVEVTTCYPEVPAVPGTPGSPPTPEQIIYYADDGWNSHSISIAEIDINNSLIYTLKTGIYAAFIGIGIVGRDDNLISTFGHGVLVDSGGVYIYENGVKVYTLSSVQSATQEIIISRRGDNTIEYSIGSNVYSSLISVDVPSIVDLYAYCFLYSGGDTLLSAEIVSDNGSIQYGNANLVSSADLSVYAGSTALLETAATLTAGESIFGTALLETESTLDVTSLLHGQVNLVATGSLYCQAFGSMGAYADLPALTGKCGESAYIEQYGVNLPAITSEAYEGSLSLAVPTRGYGSLPIISGTGFCYSPYTNEFHGDLRAPNLYISGTFGLNGELELPKLEVSGIIAAVNYLQGNLIAPELGIAGDINTVYSLIGDLTSPKLILEGEIKNGNLLEGELAFGLMDIDGTISIPMNLEGALTSPFLTINGLISVSLTDVVLEFSEEITCQQ